MIFVRFLRMKKGKVHGTLIQHLDYWEETRALNFALSVIKNGYVLQLAHNLKKYEEPNNISYKNERDWAKTAVEKLKEAKLGEKICGVSIH